MARLRAAMLRIFEALGNDSNCEVPLLIVHGTCQFSIQEITDISINVFNVLREVP